MGKGEGWGEGQGEGEGHGSGGEDWQRGIFGCLISPVTCKQT